MIDKVDLVMWTKNGDATLSLVLKRISEVIPEEFIKSRIIVDDHSTDNTRKIAESLGWQVILNEGDGISDGANTALNQVTADYFISFEQDLFLAKDWWKKIPTLLCENKTVAASGIRFPTYPLALRKLHEYMAETYEEIGKHSHSSPYGKTLDNTIYKTREIKKLGGFPKLPISGGVDTVLAQRMALAGYEWKVDHSVVSRHLRRGLRDELAHYYWYGACWPTLEHILYNKSIHIGPYLRILFFSPFRGLQLALRKKDPQIVYIYPLIRINILKGILKGRESCIF